MSGVSQQQLAELLLSATAATDVGIYGLLASQSCYHSKLVPCWFTLWTSSRFLYPYILLISLEIFLFSCSTNERVHPILVPAPRFITASGYDEKTHHVLDLLLLQTILLVCRCSRHVSTQCCVSLILTLLPFSYSDLA